MKDLKSLAGSSLILFWPCLVASPAHFAAWPPSYRRGILFGGSLRNISATVWLKSSLGEEMDQSLLLRGCLVGGTRERWSGTMNCASLQCGSPWDTGIMNAVYEGC